MGNGTGVGRNCAERQAGGTGRRIGNCFERIYSLTIPSGGIRNVRCVRVQRTVIPVVRIGPMQKFCCAVIERSCAIWARGSIAIPIASLRESTRAKLFGSVEGFWTTYASTFQSRLHTELMNSPRSFLFHATPLEEEHLIFTEEKDCWNRLNMLDKIQLINISFVPILLLLSVCFAS